MSELEPKPPEILQKIKWLHLHGSKYWFYILVATLYLTVIWIFNSLTANIYTTEEVKPNKNSHIVTKESEKNKYKKQCKNCEELYRSALEDINTNRLTAPSDNNALQKYIELKESGFDKCELVKEKILNKYMILIRLNTEQGNLQYAEELLKRMKKITNGKEINILETRIKEAKRKQKVEISKENSKVMTTIVKQEPESKNEQWIDSACYALDKATMDAAKVAILSSSLNKRKISGDNLYRLYLCGEFTMDIAKTKSIELLVENIAHETSITAKQFAGLIDTITMDEAKKDVSAKLLPLIK